MRVMAGGSSGPCARKRLVAVIAIAALRGETRHLNLDLTRRVGAPECCRGRVSGAGRSRGGGRSQAESGR